MRQQEYYLVTDELKCQLVLKICLLYTSDAADE